MKLCRLEELKEGEGVYVEVAGRALAVFLHQGVPYAMDNRCPHAGGSMSGGIVRDGRAVCPWHEWSFRLDTGELGPLSRIKIETYPTRLGKDGVVEVEMG